MSVEVEVEVEVGSMQLTYTYTYTCFRSFLHPALYTLNYYKLSLVIT